MVVRREWSLKTKGRINLPYKGFTVLKKKEEVKQQSTDLVTYITFIQLSSGKSLCFCVSQISEDELM